MKKQPLKSFLRELTLLPLLKTASRSRERTRSRKPETKIKLVLLISRTHDIDLLCNIYRRAAERSGIEAVFWARRKVLEEFPATRELLKKRGLEIEFTVGHGNLKDAISRLMQVDALLNTVESSIAEHKVASRLVRIARAAGVRTYTLQHAFENIGLTYIDPEIGNNINFAADRILTWGKPENLTGNPTPDTLAKCVAVGCPKFNPESPVCNQETPPRQPLIAIFEGLHAKQFSPDYRKHFFHDLQETANRFQEFIFMLKPHPSITKRAPDHAAALRSLNNITVLDPADPTNNTTWPTPKLLATARGVITTPSTIALDTALNDTPVAVTRYRMESPNYKRYQPLPLLDNTNDWHNFLQDLQRNRQGLKEKTGSFRKRVIIPGDAAARILDIVEEEHKKTILR
ncbi:MAG: hypothetical protein GXO34_05555 [Deltaproteobacteria bacterium]|nr:hypothetical protein [Deltaproteobacteria bacterium]